MKAFVRYLIASVGLLFVALGVALAILSNLGTPPLTCEPYVLNLKFPSISVGTFTMIVNTCMILVQLIVLRKDFKAISLMQIVASAIFGYMIDAWIWVLACLHPATFLSRLGLILMAGLVTAFGVSIETRCKAWMLSAEMTVQAFSDVFHKPFGKVKIVMDSLMVVLGAATSLLSFGNALGSGEFTGLLDVLLASMPGIVIGIGTLLLAFLPGFLMRLTDPLVAKMLVRLR